jgi:ferritin-like metal-binding protein YciE
MAISSMHQLFIEELRDMYHAEKQLTKALPKMAKAASDSKLKEAFESHAEETEGQVERLEKVFESLDERTKGRHCEAMEGLIEEAKEIMEEIDADDVRDAAMIVAAQKVEHYEIAGYGSLHAMAEAMGHTEAARLLQETLAEEKATDEKLNSIAVGGVNAKAMAKAA